MRLIIHLYKNAQTFQAGIYRIWIYHNEKSYKIHQEDDLESLK